MLETFQIVGATMFHFGTKRFRFFDLELFPITIDGRCLVLLHDWSADLPASERRA
jgi:hypothetical protein